MNYHAQGLQQEADLRFSLVRVRENAESIAFYNGEKAEEKVANSRLRRLLETLDKRIKCLRSFAFFANAYDFATIVVPSCLMAPAYFRGEVSCNVQNICHLKCMSWY